MASHSRVLYCGVTNNLDRRVWEHRNGLDPNVFTTRYRVYRLVYVEQYDDPDEAIRRETQIKSYRRSKKIALIERLNPEWRDLAPAQVPRRLRGSE